MDIKQFEKLLTTTKVPMLNFYEQCDLFVNSSSHQTEDEFVKNWCRTTAIELLMQQRTDRSDYNKRLALFYVLLDESLNWDLNKESKIKIGPTASGYVISIRNNNYLVNQICDVCYMNENKFCKKGCNSGRDMDIPVSILLGDVVVKK